jgi:uncharacterized protein
VQTNRIVVTGGTGFIGRKLVAELVKRGDSVTVLARRAGDPRVPAGADSTVWEPEKEGPWMDVIGSASAVVHLAGEPVLGRWTEEKRKRIVDSRVLSTKLLLAAMERAPSRPRVFVCASAVGYYGAHSPEEDVDETSPAGDDFLAAVVRAWEDEAKKAAALGVREVRLRIGIVLGEDGGALSQMLTPFRFFVGGPVGSGKQPFSWVHHQDVVNLLLLALDDERVKGPLNATAPNPVDMDGLARALGRALGRPSAFRVPAFMVRFALGEAAFPILTGQRVLPREAERLGYQFRFADLDRALADVVGKQ